MLLHYVLIWLFHKRFGGLNYWGVCRCRPFNYAAADLARILKLWLLSPGLKRRGHARGMRTNMRWERRRAGGSHLSKLSHLPIGWQGRGRTFWLLSFLCANCAWIFFLLPPLKLNDCQPATHFSGDSSESFPDHAGRNRLFPSLLQRWTSQLVCLMFKGTISSINPWREVVTPPPPPLPVPPSPHSP